MISIAGFKDYWGRTSSVDEPMRAAPEADWYHLTDHPVGLVSFQVLLDEWLPGIAVVENWLRTWI